MKRTLLCLSILLGITLAAFADPVIYVEPPLAPQSPVVMAQGGSFTANASGFDALYTNPAGFSNGKPSLTILTVNPWLYALPSQEMINGLTQASGDPTALIGDLSSLLTGSGTGAGFLVGLGYVGGGFGIGALITNDTFAHGVNVLGVTVDSNITAAVIGGASLPIHLGPVTLTPGADVRPMYRLSARGMAISNFLGALAGGSIQDVQANVLAGTAIAFDVGLNVTVGPLTAALAVRDLGNTTFSYTTSSFADTVNALASFTLPHGVPIDKTVAQYTIPMSFHAGLEFHPDLGAFSKVLDPSVHAEYVVNSLTNLSSFDWNNVHLGTEVALFQFIRLRAGLNQGYVTFGAGVKLLFFDVNVAYFSRELGAYPGADQNQGISAAVALRF